MKPVVAQIAECLADWYKRAQTIYLKAQILEKDVITCDDALFTIREQIFRKKDEVKSDDTNRVCLEYLFESGKSSKANFIPES